MAGLYALGEALAVRGMGLVLDIVPNHVGIAGGANPWWRSVLRHGEASPYASYFDIDWQAQPQMATGILVFPVLGEPFGRTLEAGQLTLAVSDGELVVRYFDQAFPLRPESYARVLGLPPLDVHSRLKDPAATASLAGAIEALSTGQYEPSEAALTTVKGVLGSEPALASWAARSAGRFNGLVGDPASFDALDELLSGQHYRLADWRVAGAEINYRRFFDQNSLAAIRVEREDVFVETHRLLFDLTARGIVTGVRVDHVDGLYAPSEYLGRLRDGLAGACRGIPGADIPVFVEKILQGGESLPNDWPVAGTTGYDAMAEAGRLFIDPAGARECTRTYTQFVGPVGYDSIRYESKREIARSAFAGEISVLATQLHRLAQRSRLHRDNTLRALRGALEGTIACFPVYRTYTDAATRADDDANYIAGAIEEAERRNPNLSDSALLFLKEVLLPDVRTLADEDREQRAHFRRRFQQITGPIMAKGLEDTAFFRYNRLLALNDVGGDPAAFGATPAEVHASMAARARDWPGAMFASSTHDTKRSEDVRARISVLSEMPAEWRREVLGWARLNDRFTTLIHGERAPSANLEYYLYQTLVGSWPGSGDSRVYQKRLRDHLTKAMREAKTRTSWQRPDEEYEAATLAFADAILTGGGSRAFRRRLQAFVDRIRPAAELNSLAALALKCMAPGFPDFYQGSELIDLSLTDPDNRRPIDFERCNRLLAESRGFDPWLRSGTDEAAKPWLTRVLLDVRQTHRAELVSAPYEALDVSGSQAGRVFAFSRGSHLALVVPRLCSGLMGPDGSIEPGAWAETGVVLPPGSWRNALTGAVHSGERLPMAQLPPRFPIAVLERQ